LNGEIGGHARLLGGPCAVQHLELPGIGSGLVERCRPLGVVDQLRVLGRDLAVPVAWACRRYGKKYGIWLQSYRYAAILGSVIGPGFPDVLAAAQDGDEEAFTQLWLDGNSALLRYLWVTAPEAAEDIAAETWVHVIRGLRRFRGDEAAWRAWLFTTARRRTIDQARRRSRLAGTPVHDLPASRLPVAADAADVALERLSTGAVIALLADLPPLQAEVILLRVVAGLDTEAVARLVRRSPGAVRVAAHRGLRKLAQILTEAGVTL
jgi:RNA polymerase sigma-70 factor, ECF subfamily